MSESVYVSECLSRAEKYAELLPQLYSLTADEPELVANLANVSAALKSVFGFFWVGFYFVKGEELVLGPFQGPVACTRFPVSKGVCGAAATRMETVLVPDVDAFPGHIACSSESRSEIVVPLVAAGATRLVLDVDSDLLDDFGPEDQQGLEAIIAMLGKIHFAG
ncbi:MAG: GAF domain-containing protein [Bacteroidia bacterium]|nr:GAF domain-containing protein [Bacteroidia bacterium]